MMKAAVVVGINDIQYKDVPEPSVGPGLVKVRMKYCGICGSDIPRVLKGTCHSFPQVLGHECSGIVSEIGDGVKSFHENDHVVIVPLIPCMKCKNCHNGNFALCENYSFIGSRQQGGMAEYLVVPEQNVLKIDKRIPLKKAALFEPSSVALHGLMLNGFSPKPNNRICIFGAGTIALFTLQWCKILGGQDVTIVGRSRDRLSIATGYGADHVISSLDNGFYDSLMKITDGCGFDYIYDCAGTNETIHYCVQTASNKAKICFIGTPTAPVTFDVKLWELINRKELSITGSWMSYSEPWPGDEWRKTIEHTLIGDLVIDENLIHKQHALKDIKQVFKIFEDIPSSIKGRVIICID